MRIHSRVSAALTALLLTLAPLTGAAQSALASADAKAFLGVWTLGLETPQGSMSMKLVLKDMGGKVAGTISAEPVMPGEQEITDIKVDAGTLILAYALDMQGQAIPAKISLVPSGDMWIASFDFADGQFVMGRRPRSKVSLPARPGTAR
jgi:hypothetical protein